MSFKVTGIVLCNNKSFTLFVLESSNKLKKLVSSRVVRRADGEGGGPHVLRQAIASWLEPRAEKRPPP